MNDLDFGMNLQVVPLISPYDATSTDPATPFVKVSRAAGLVKFLVPFGTITGDSCTVTLDVATANSTVGLTDVAVGFRYRLSAAVGGDSWGAVTTADSTGVAVTANDDDKILLIEYDPRENEDYEWARLTFTTGGSMSNCEIAAVAVFKPRYAQLDQLSST